MVVKPDRYAHSEVTPVYSVFSPMDRFVQGEAGVPFSGSLPVKNVPILFNSPHSGRNYPASFLEKSRLLAQDLRKSEDAFIDELIDFVPSLGAYLMVAHMPRSFIDLNREPYELDPELFSGVLPSYANIQTIRVQNGLGTIPRIVSDQEPIYPHEIDLDEGLDRIDTFYHPYHERLSHLLSHLQKEWGYSVLIDCHSMPSSTVAGSFKKVPDIVLGNRFGKSCDVDFSSQIREIFRDLGYRVSMNKPYAGGFITENYGRPSQGTHAVQIEINRGIYLEESRFERAKDFSRLRQDLQVAFSNIIDYARDYFQYSSKAAQ